MPHAWWPAGWAEKFQDPVCELLYAVYGHPKAGDLCADQLSAILKELGFELVGNLPSLFHKLTPKGPILIDVYVDDFIMSGKFSVCRYFCL